jgi:hypothetical protein
MTIPTETKPPATLSAAGATQLTQAVVTAAALIELAIQDSLAPIETLGRAIARIAAAAPAPALAPELAACVESLQFHDRMTQQLTQVRDLLAGAAGEAAPPDEPRDWPALRERLREHFTTDSHRMLFNLLMPADDRHEHARLHAGEGGVELF